MPKTDPGLRVVEDALDAESILKEAEPKRTNKLEKWLSEQEQSTQDLVWETMSLMRERDKPFDPTYRAFMAHFTDDLPLGCLQAKRHVNDKLDAANG